MKIQLIRNATLVLQYAGRKFLIDPFLAEKGSIPPFPNTPNQDQSNPLVSLPSSIEEIIDVDAVIVTHLHPDHFDEVAKEVLPKDIKIFAQNEHDVEAIKKDGFYNAESLHPAAYMGEIRLTRTNGQHGIGEITKFTGEVSGVVFHHPDEQTLYVAGDTVWCGDVEEAIHTHHPDVIIVNGGAAQFLEGGPIIMTKEDIYKTHQAAPQATMIVCHMEALNHCLLTREELNRFIDENGISNHIFVPSDGETYTL
ncbi:MBL fold metallo-hydrolase [Melghirimyces algeriensis]|uniref:L-ascorbate metabolism protein UlaG, beta-lactamase superfamily n=1 Tax=Melghirimyces algeriensis TaxID=910412 RepID=A0A521E2P9_9BACL|nr:MBL fold metallo-hydrolase [Melghirimyces algeriensis]SMO78236.1 L-ascorbate metabolism protein UlaG, beta-lactamase superfamily [Melghirimyces algeriensis]